MSTIRDNIMHALDTGGCRFRDIPKLINARYTVNAPILHIGELRHLYPNVDVTREGTFHNALDDAKWQAELLQAIMKVRAATVPASAYSAVKELADARGDFLTQLEKAGALDESPCHPGYESNTVTCCKRRIQHAEERVYKETTFTDMM